MRLSASSTRDSKGADGARLVCALGAYLSTGCHPVTSGGMMDGPELLVGKILLMAHVWNKRMLCPYGRPYKKWRFTTPKPLLYDLKTAVLRPENRRF